MWRTPSAVREASIISIYYFYSQLFNQCQCFSTMCKYQKWTLNIQASSSTQITIVGLQIRDYGMGCSMIVYRTAMLYIYCSMTDNPLNHNSNLIINSFTFKNTDIYLQFTVPVSYTHLDVYKRQRQSAFYRPVSQSSQSPPRRRRSLRGLFSSSPGKRLAQTGS